MLVMTPGDLVRIVSNSAHGLTHRLPIGSEAVVLDPRDQGGPVGLIGADVADAVAFDVVFVAGSSLYQFVAADDVEKIVEDVEPEPVEADEPEDVPTYAVGDHVKIIGTEGHWLADGSVGTVVRMGGWAGLHSGRVLVEGCTDDGRQVKQSVPLFNLAPVTEPGE